MTTILSPHLDDAAWSCHSLLEGATVITVCAGIPPESVPPTQFDRRAGFTSGAQAMRARRAEDLLAAQIAGFTAVHLDVLDAGYGDDDIGAAVRGVLADIEEGETIVGPLGLRHPDHQAVARAFLAAARDHPDAWVYEELPYAYVWPQHLAPALSLAGCSELTVTRVPDAMKEPAVRAYGSQVNEDTHMTAILAPERLHRL